MVWVFFPESWVWRVWDGKVGCVGRWEVGGGRIVGGGDPQWESEQDVK